MDCSKELVKRTFDRALSDPSTKGRPEAYALLAEYVNTYINEIIARVDEEATVRGSDTLNVEILEDLLPELLYDFST
eukprot:CAMPEP_0175148078 /NCGR_PEP_ID=MMETSP0087-20121206/16398_1 /TAXON_ID=136419 /ORGANISM="Unknown Unknown, Strain D1" /LENGTH=76 /DNA_ID=CAMNT_0016433439 /DNA_START=47 /DNA_END=277 /DNA_ORIENTATION=+